MNPKSPFLSLGFTGTRVGLTSDQEDRIQEKALDLRPNEAIHGACVGADNFFDCVMSNLGIFRRIYPSNIEILSAVDLCRVRKGSCYIHASAHPIDRNRWIVDRSVQLWVAPKEMKEVQRSGTWMTYRYGIKKRIPITVFWPDGTITIWS